MNRPSEDQNQARVDQWYRRRRDYPLAVFGLVLVILCGWRVLL